MDEYNVRVARCLVRRGGYTLECCDCRRMIKIRKDGRIPRHDPPANWSPNQWKKRPCINSGQIAILRKEATDG